MNSKLQTKAFFVFGALILCGLIGCNARYEKVAPETENSDVSPTFAVIQREILNPRCVTCHGSAAQMPLTDYDSTHRHLDDIERMITERKMPPQSPLTRNQIALFERWVALGAPADALPTPQPSPSPSPSPTPVPSLEPTFSSIHDGIFAVRCLSCHSSGQSGKHVPLDTKDDLLNSPRDLVLPRDPDESGLVIALSRKDDKRMPPPSSGPPLTLHEIQVIREWILKGAP